MNLILLGNVFPVTPSPANHVLDRFAQKIDYPAIRIDPECALASEIATHAFNFPCKSGGQKMQILYLSFLRTHKIGNQGAAN
jgi:hypothetical protein